MMLDSKQRSYLNKLAANIPDIIYVGKSGINDEIVEKTKQNLKARELIKGKVLQNSPIGPKQVAEELAEKTDSEIVRVIGKKFILYKFNPKKKENILPEKPSNKK